MNLTGEGGIYKATWDEDGIEITFERFNEDRKSVTAALWIRDHLLPHSLVRFEFSQNIGSSRSISTLANELQATHPLLNDLWKRKLVEASHKVLISYMAGEPVRSIRDVELTEAAMWQIEPFVFMQYPTLLYGDGGIGKSMFAAFLATLVTEGWVTDDIGVEPCPVLYLDWESSEDDLAERSDMISAGLELIDRPNLFHRFCSRPLASDIEFIRREVIERNIGLVIIDSAGPASSKPTDADEVIKFFTALRSLKTSSLILGHKPQAGNNPFGSVYWKNYSRSVWEMVSDASENLPYSDIALINTKVNRGPLSPRMGYRVTFSDTPTGKAVFYNAIDAGDMEDVADKLPLKEQVTKILLATGSMHYKDVADALKVTEGQIKTCFTRNKNRFQALGGGLYGVSQQLAR